VLIITRPRSSQTALIPARHWVRKKLALSSAELFAVPCRQPIPAHLHLLAMVLGAVSLLFLAIFSAADFGVLVPTTASPGAPCP
jgi:hypothetical protein